MTETSQAPDKARASGVMLIAAGRYCQVHQNNYKKLETEPKFEPTDVPFHGSLPAVPDRVKSGTSKSYIQLNPS